MNERITFNSEQCGGRPCIRGLRIRVKDILDLLAAKVPRQEILEDFPYLEDEDIDACLQYAVKLGDRSVVWWCAAGFWTAAMIRRWKAHRSGQLRALSPHAPED